jgi:hypothetical protein
MKEFQKGKDPDPVTGKAVNANERLQEASV